MNRLPETLGGIVHVIAQQQPGAPPPHGPLFTPELFIPVALLVITLGIVLVVVARRRRAAMRMDEAFDRLRKQWGLRLITDQARRNALGRCIQSLVTGKDLSVAESPVPLRHVLEYRGRDFQVTLVQVDIEGFRGWHELGPMGTDMAMTAVICDNVEVSLPRFTLVPASMGARAVHGPGRFPQSTAFGRDNLVYSPDAVCLHHIFDQAVQLLLAGNRTIAIECAPHYLMLYRHDRSIDVEALHHFLEDAIALAQLIHDNARALVESTDDGQKIDA